MTEKIYLEVSWKIIIYAFMVTFILKNVFCKKRKLYKYKY